MSQFESLGLLPELVSATASLGWLLPRDVQDESIPLILGGSDVMIAAETGSGKTGAFCLPALQLVYEYVQGQAIVTNKAIKIADEKSTETNTGICMSSSDRDSICAVSGDGLTVQTRHPRDWGGIRSSHGVQQGKFAFEVLVQDEGLVRVGFATKSATRNIGTDAFSFGYGGTAKKSHAGKFIEYGETFGKGDRITAVLSLLTSQNIEFLKNGKSMGIAFEIPSSLQGQTFYPAVCMKNAEIKCEFANSQYLLPSGALMIEMASQAQRGAAESSSSAPAPSSSSSSSSSPSSYRLSDGPLVLIIEPTRELALQVDAEISKFKSYLDNPRLLHQTFTGGMDYRDSNDTLSRGIHIAVGTPGKLNELIKNGKLKLNSIRLLILDEADQLIDIGSKQDITTIYQRINQCQERIQTVICSATLHSNEITELAQKITVNAQWVDLKGRDSIPSTVDHAVVLVNPDTDRSWMSGKSGHTDGVHRGIALRGDTKEVLSEGTKLLKPQVLMDIVQQFKMDQCMIFARTQVDCDQLEQYFIEYGGGGSGFKGKKESGKENPFSCVVLHAGRRPEERERNLQAFRDGDVRFLICTDVAARGIDIVGLPFVINLTLPDNPVQYIHRVGRVGRADAVGLAISIVSTKQEKQWFHTCNRQDRGRGCTNTALTADGGCCIWFDELAALQAIEAKLGQIKVPHFDRHSLLKGAKHIVERAAAGRAKPADQQQQADIQSHLSVLKPTVKALHQLELEAQWSYLELKTNPRWKQQLATAKAAATS